VPTRLIRPPSSNRCLLVGLGSSKRRLPPAFTAPADSGRATTDGVKPRTGGGSPRGWGCPRK
jgi:hypothetical protein